MFSILVAPWKRSFSQKKKSIFNFVYFFLVDSEEPSQTEINQDASSMLDAL
jgi:hypothetical protein